MDNPAVASLYTVPYITVEPVSTTERWDVVASLPQLDHSRSHCRYTNNSRVVNLGEVEMRTATNGESPGVIPFVKVERISATSVAVPLLG